MPFTVAGLFVARSRRDEGLSLPGGLVFIAVPVQPKCELHLARDWDAAWREIVRPWLAAPAALRRDFVLVPTRGQAAAFKLRCVREGVPLLGVEFLTPGLARQKWLALAATGVAAHSPLKRPALGRELLLLGLRVLIERRLAPLPPEAHAWGMWKSLQSDPERALDDFDELLKAGFTADHLPTTALREIFTELTAWVDSIGFTLAAWQGETAALTPVPPETPRLGGRLLVLGFTAEAWGEFFNLAALVRCGGEVTVVLPEPEFARKDIDERWIETWEQFFQVNAVPLDVPEPGQSCAAVGALWAGPGGSVDRARILVGHTRADEMALVADELTRLLGAGADNIAVIFPRADAAHLRLAQLLVARGVPFSDLLETAGQPPIDVQLQRALLAFYERGARLEELLALWPLLHALNFVSQPLGVARDACERLFDESQTHALTAYRDRLAGADRAGWREIGRVTELLLPAWPGELTLADALQRFETVGGKFNLAPPATWPALAAFARRETRLLPARVVFGALGSFLPAMVPASDVPGRGCFAPVTLTTRRRAGGVAWSHVILVESNAGSWPARAESSCWLTDEQRRSLNEQGRFSFGLFTGDDRAALEKQGYVALARASREQVVFSAALFDEEEPELRLAPNVWLERVMIAQGLLQSHEGGLEEALARLAQTILPPPPEPSPDWREVWQRRRDPRAPFDDHFFSGPPAVTRPARLAARLIERGVQDPAELWFEAVLGTHRVDWMPLVRARKKSLGQFAHRMLAEAMHGAPVEGIFMAKPAVDEARARLAAVLTSLRSKWPRDRYWDSLHGELSELCAVLLEKVFKLPTGSFVAVEARLPEGATVPLGADQRLPVHGRMDLVLLDRPGWGGAQVDIADFKTGADTKLSAGRMARGASLQLGIYLAAVQSLGIAGGRVWMLKPEAGASASLEVSELPDALVTLEQLGRHLATGRYGALTPDRTEFSHGYEWPLACTPVRHAVLTQKFAATFGLAAASDAGEANDE